MNQTVTVDIRGIAIGGDGVGTVTAQSVGTDLLGITAFVSGTAVGDKILATVGETKKNYIKGALVEVIESSATRVEPPCRYYHRCGGCELQHIAYDAQLDAKFEMIIGALRAARLPIAVIDSVESIVPSNAYSYRRRITLHVDSQGKVGFYQGGSRTVVAIDRCEITVPAINACLENIRDFGYLVAGKISSILLETDASGLVAVLKAPYDLTPQEQKQILDSARPFFKNVSLVVAEREIDGYGRRILDLPLTDSGSVTLRIPAGHFSQVNWTINRKLIQAVVAAANPETTPSLFDLYSGAGNFSIPLAHAGAKVVAVESDKNLVELGKENVSQYGFSNKLSFVHSSVEKFLSTASAVDVIVADPPRSGLGKLCSKLPKCQTLILICCHVPSFVRDLRSLVDAGWQVDRIIPFDMFAQTSYLEILVVLRQPR